MADETAGNGGAGKRAEGPSHEPGRVSAVDRSVGARMCALREAAGLSVMSVASALGMTPEAYAARERGEARMGADDLFRLSKFLNVTVGAFFE